MSSSKKKGSKSSKKPSSNIDNSPSPNIPFNLDPNAYHPALFSSAPDSPMFSPSQNQILQNLVYNLSQNQHPFPTQGQNVFTTPSPPQPESQFSETQMFSRQPRRLLASDTEEEEEEEEEEAEADEEAEEEQLQRRQQRPAKSRGKGKAPAVQRPKGPKGAAWHVDEVVALARTWVDISEDAIEGNDQDITAFQVKIWRLWCERMGRQYRTPQAIYSKWRNESKVAKDFESIFTQQQRNWQSGANIDDVMVAARSQYVVKYGTKQPFNLQAESFWRIVRDNQKWKSQTSFHQFAIHTSKRSKTSASTHSASSDAHNSFDMNEEPQDDVLPMGRDQAKRKMRGDSSGTNASSHASHASAELKQATEELATLESLQDDKVRAKLIDVITRDISGLRGFQYQLALEGKKMAAKRLGISFTDDE